MNGQTGRMPSPPLQARLQLLLWRYGIWPLLLLTLLLVTGMLWWGRALPVRQQIAALDAGRAGPVVAAAAPAVDPQAATDRARLQAFQQVLLPYRDHPAQLRRLVRQTRQELQWTQAEFSQHIDAGPGLSRLQVTVPVVGTYPAVQSAIERALLQSPNLSLDQIQFRREAADRPQLETRIRLSLWLRAPSQDAGAR
jgi:hypothetical protein